MHIVTAFFRLVRSLNLLFIVLTQCMFLFFIVHPILGESFSTILPSTAIVCIIAASVLIAAGGNVINDYFDINIDIINKPSKRIVDKYIRRRWVIVWHLLLSSLGILLTAYVAWVSNAWWMLLGNIAVVLVLWMYSASFKKKLLTGNIIISLLTAWVILVIGGWVHYILIINGLQNDFNSSKLLRLTFLYAGFAFIISLVREVIKDIEDRKGDQKYGCKTMPIVWGIQVCKIFINTWLIILLVAIATLVVYVLPYKWWYAIIYCIIFLLAPLIRVIKGVSKAQTVNEFTLLSSQIKIVMLFGILSMVFFKIY